ncbi:MAG: chemotaxis protein [Desulfuromonadales bacterium GWD2_61_12]|nr:MAG: chemotaxis protein [Desulfuromonadales bacterium GWC2_61_20]OGR33941.1 MAG: chemotaxis protein [Desulfuromonadales bacterium GWD2_61_12]HAD05136.1 methyl-accepting chemotaxis protein [Desulfuromonas sp.]HBT82131.1 methyl-accepting chemotaxis protein [Desulfuromonas sp.]
MFRWVTDRIALKIVVSLILVLLVILAGFTVFLVDQRSRAMEESMLTKARTLAVTGSKAMEQVLEEAIDSGRLSQEEVFDTDYREIKEGPLARSAIPKYHTSYDTFLDQEILKIEDAFVDEDSMVVFAVLVDVNGYLPVHNSRYSKPLTGDAEKDKVGNRTKRLFNDPTGIAAAKYDGKDGNKILKQVYRRDTGETMWDVSAPVYVKGKHWGGFRIGLSMQEVEVAVNELRNSIVLSMLVVLLIAGATIAVVVTRIIRPLKELTGVAERIAAGGFDESIDIRSNDEIGKLAAAFNRMTQVIVKNLKTEVEKSARLMTNIKAAIQQLSTSANEIVAISAEQSAGATEQATAVQQATTTSEEIAVTAKQVAQNAIQVETQAERANAAGKNGSRAVDNAMEGMGILKGKIQSVAEAMLQLGENSQKVGGIVDIIDEISDQTNLLALNATIEAAGAGEAGKRFAVVANEVKRLAERTVEATAQIKHLIEEIQKATNATIMLTEEGTKGADAANDLVGRVSVSLREIMQLIQETTAAAREIKFSTQQQTSASEEMASTIVEVRDVAAQVASSAQETTQAISELTGLAERLKELVEEEG